MPLAEKLRHSNKSSSAGRVQRIWENEQLRKYPMTLTSWYVLAQTAFVTNNHSSGNLLGDVNFLDCYGDLLRADVKPLFSLPF